MLSFSLKLSRFFFSFLATPIILFSSFQGIVQPKTPAQNSFTSPSAFQIPQNSSKTNSSSSLPFFKNSSLQPQNPQTQATSGTIIEIDKVISFGYYTKDSWYKLSWITSDNEKHEKSGTAKLATADSSLDEFIKELNKNAKPWNPYHVKITWVYWYNWRQGTTYLYASWTPQNQIKTYSGNIAWKQHLNAEKHVSYFDIQLSNESSKTYHLGQYYNKETKKTVLGDNVYFNRFLDLIRQNALFGIKNPNFSFEYYKNEANDVLTFTKLPIDNNQKNPKLLYSGMAHDVYEQGFANNDPYNFTQKDYFTKQFKEEFFEHRKNQYKDDKEFKKDEVTPSGLILWNSYLLSDDILEYLRPKDPRNNTPNRTKIDIEFFVPGQIDSDHVEKTWMNEFISFHIFGSFILEIYFNKVIKISKDWGLYSYQILQALVT